MGRNCGRTVIIALLCTVLAGPILGAEENDRPASVIVAIVPGEKADTAYQSVLRNALLVNLTRNRMEGTAVETADDARALARQGTGDYVILGTWRNTTDTIELTLEVSLPKGTKPLATATASGRISLTMDSVVGAALDRLLPAMQARFPLSAAEAAAAAAAAAGTSTTSTAATGSGHAGSTSTTATGSGTTATVTAVGPSDGGAGLPQPPARWRRVELALGGAPLVTTGTVAEYAKIGAFSALDFDLRFSVGRSVLSAGLLAGAGWFRAVGVGVADVLVVPVGPDVHWTIDADANPGVSLHAAAGPAAVVAMPDWADTLVKLAPFVAGGLIVDIGLTPGLGLRIEAEYTVVFEGSMVLQGFTPRLALRTRF